MSRPQLMLISFILAAAPLWAQSSAPVVVQAATPSVAAPAAPAVAAAAQSNQPTLKLLQEIKAANEAVLSKQAATLQQLDELEKAADQIKVYTKRG